MLNLDEMDAFFDAHYQRSAFRLETLDAYEVASDGGDVARYLRGEPDPDPERKGPWLQELAAERAAGKTTSRVRILTTPLSDYLRYECEWGYVPNSEAGEQIRILDLTTTARPRDVVNEDFWLLDDTHALRMVYDADGRFKGAIVADDPQPYRAARDAAWNAAVDFATWWAAHPNEHRVNRTTV